MSNLLLGDHSIPVIPELACAVGLNEAIILQQIYYWTDINEKRKQNFADGHYWVYNSCRQWREQFPWLSERTIQRLFSSLEKRGLIISGTYNKLKMDRTKWYRVDRAKIAQVIQSRQDGALDSDTLS